MVSGPVQLQKRSLVVASLGPNDVFGERASRLAPPRSVMPELLDPDSVDAALAAGVAWERHGDELVKTHRGRNFADSLAYVNAVGALAEEMDHHPDIDIRWNTVTLRLTTHSEGGLTRLDLDLARRIDALSAPGG